MNRKKFGEFLTREREARGMTKTALAKRAGVTLRAVQYWEQGNKNISLENVAKLLDALDMKIIFVKKGGQEHENSKNYPGAGQGLRE